MLRTQALIRTALIFMLITGVSIPSADAAVTTEALSLDGADTTVPTYLWSDSAVKPKAVLIGLHGGVQHGRNYEALAKKLSANGFIFYAIDFRGHGSWLQAKKRPKVDYPGTTDDVLRVAQQLRERHPKLPLFCLGESLGAAVAMRASLMQPGIFDGLVLASAGGRPASLKAHAGATLRSIGHGIKTLGGTIDISAHLKQISEDPRSSNETITDPLSRRESSVWSLLHTVGFLHSAHRLAPQIANVPILVLQGNDDQIVDPDSTQDLYEDLATRNKSIKRFPSIGHLLITNHFIKDEVVASVQDWLTAQSNALVALQNQ
jgi:alpha-beta hydrolase superfamily lysophospholipase